MNLNEMAIEAMAVAMLAEHAPDYHFRWSNGKSTAGWCSWSDKYIAISRWHVANSSMEFCMDTVIHEVAHAMTPNHHHDNIWRTACIVLGGNGKRCYDYGDRFAERRP